MDILKYQHFNGIYFQWRKRNPSGFNKNFLICVWGEEQTSYGFGTTWGTGAIPLKYQFYVIINYLFLKAFL